MSLTFLARRLLLDDRMTGSRGVGMLGMCVVSSLCWLGCVSTSRLLGWEIVPVLEPSLSPL